MEKKILLSLLLFCIVQSLLAQGSAFGIKGGVAFANQNNNNYQREILIGKQADVYIETLSEENNNALFASIGYHQRGSATRFPQYISQGGQTIVSRSENSEYNNLVLQLGAKQKFDLGFNALNKWYFSFAFRGDYNVKTKLPTLYKNLEDNTTKITYGMSVGAGLEFMFAELAGGIIELNVHPDLSDQLIIPPQQSVIQPGRVFPERRVRNFTIEVSLGIRLIHKVIYLD